MREVRAADLILTIGFDPVELRADWIAPWDETKRVVSIDLVPNTHHVYRASAEYVGSIAGCLRTLAGGARATERWPDDDLDAHRAAVERAIAHNPERGLGPYVVAERLRKIFPRDTLATIDTGSHRILINHVWQAYEPR